MYPYRCMVMKLERRNNVSISVCMVMKLDEDEIMYPYRCMVMKLERRNNVSIPGVWL